jgi:cephalosporin hydroxylase/predicted SAM-dependent methyltransferase
MSVSANDKDARRLLKEGQSMAALRLAEQTVKANPESAAAHFLHGMVQEVSARYEEALTSFRRCLELGGHGDAATRVATLEAALERPPLEHVPTGLRSWHADLPHKTLQSIQNALHNFKYKNTPLQKNPFDYALYPMLLWQFRPRTIIEIGSKEGGSALWMGDLCDTFGLDCSIHSIDIVRVATVKHRRVQFHEGDGRNLGNTLTEKMLKRLPRPWLVIEDADHSYDTTHAVLQFFEEHLTPTDMLVVEDGIISDLSKMSEGASGPHRALRKFLQKHYAEWEILPEWCDFFGYNFTWSSNGFLRKTGLKKLSQDVAPEQQEAIAKIKAKEFSAALELLQGKSAYGVDYLRAYAHWRLDQLPEAQAAALREVNQSPGHQQARRFADLLTAKLEGTRISMPKAASKRIAASGENLRVNLGCGQRFHSDWLNFDVVPVNSQVLAHDLTQALPLDDGSCAVVYHSHVLEHLPKADAPRFIAECFRVLKPGGILRVAVPDMEGIARAYLKQLDAAAAGDAAAAAKHDWMTHEMVDQLARHKPGGNMLDYWKQNPMPAEEFVVSRMGLEVQDKLVELKAAKASPPSSHVGSSAKVGEFRTEGEVHQWMYDRVSLGRILAAAGFVAIKIQGATESAVSSWADYLLDTDEQGAVRKPDSLFMEAVKP